MPRYFFDFEDGDRHSRDEVGLDFPDPVTARHEALRTLPAIAKDEMPGGDRRDFAVSVRDEAGRVFLRVTLALKAEWLDPRLDPITQPALPAADRGTPG